MLTCWGKHATRSSYRLINISNNQFRFLFESDPPHVATPELFRVFPSVCYEDSLSGKG